MDTNWQKENILIAWQKNFCKLDGCRIEAA